MADFLHATDLGSDSDDSDYNPAQDEGKVVSEEEDDGDREEDDNQGKRKKTKKSKEPAVTSRRGGLFDDDDPEEAEARRKEFDQEKKEIKEQEESKKIDDLWADFKTTTSKPKAKTGSGLGSICSSTSTAGKSSTKVKSSSSRPASKIRNIFDDIDIDEKKEEEKETPKPTAIRSVFDRLDEDEVKEEKPSEEDTGKENGSAKEGDTMKITQVFDFAGENVSITKEVDKDSKEAKKFLKKQEELSSQATKTPVENALSNLKRPAGSGGGGLGSIMDQISGKKAKMGCLDKSKMDWNKFVDTEGLREDLTTHNRGKEGYVEKQEFLERADHRRFEAEKAAREKTRKTLNR